MDHRLHGSATPSDPRVSPDGERVAFVVTTVDSEDDLYRSRIWIHDGEGARPFTAGDGDTAPRWSPDGTRLAFLRRVDDRPQAAVIPVDGGEATVVTEFLLGARGEAVWSPDGSALAVAGGIWVGEWAEMDEEERSRRPRRIRRRDYRADGSGWTHDRRAFVYLVDPHGGGAPRRLTDGYENESQPRWSPDGRTIAFFSDRSSRPGYEPGTDILVSPVDGGAAEVVAPRGMWYSIAYRPDGVLHALGYPGDEFPDLQLLWRFAPRPERVSPDNRALFPLGAGPDRFLFFGDTALTPYVDSGSVGLVAISPDGATQEAAGGRSVVTGFDRVGEVLATTESTVDHPGRLVVEDGVSSTVVEDFGGAWPTVVVPEHFVVDGPGAALDVWVYLPPGDAHVPLLLNIHGGPASQYGWGYFDEFQIYAAAGYGVVATNPRGSGGRDREFLRAVTGKGWGQVDVEDIDAVVSAALDRHPRLDRERLGVMGGSYGGFLTAWLIAHSGRWKAAVVERALLSWPSFGGTSDIGGWFADRYLGETELEWDRSPLRLASRVTTPTLVIHSEQDFRCPIEQAEQYFDGLLRAGVEAEFVRFPGEGHELSRSGQPRHREERFEIILDWLSRRL